MAMHLAGRSGGGRRRAYKPMSEINVTPFVDVMLVLLVIFMVTAPLLTVSVPVDLPTASAKSGSKPDKPLVISITAEGKIFLSETEVSLADLIAKLREATKADKTRRIYIRGDRSIAYGKVMALMSALTEAGFTKVALVAEDGKAPADAKTPRESPKDGR